MRKNQKGFTLVELIIAVAILAVVTIAVCGFIMVGSRSYTSANTDIMLQQDAQLALNQMSDVIIDTTESISYSGLVGGSMQIVLKDSEFSGEATDKSLLIVNKKPVKGDPDKPDDLNQNPSYVFYFNKDQGKIYYNEVNLYEDTDTPTAEEIKNKFDAALHMFDDDKPEDDKPVLAEHVTEFGVDLTQFEQNRVVMLTLAFENGDRVYSTSNNVTVRNRIALNQITVDPLKKADEFKISVPASIVIEPGEKYTFPTPTVTTDDADKSVKWALLGEPQNGTTISEAGVLDVNIGETRENFKVTVTRASIDDPKSTEEVTVRVKRATSVDFTGASSAKQGETITLTARAGDRNGLLGEQCNGDNHVGDQELAKDKYVTGWTVIEGDAHIESSDNGSASVKIGDDAAVGSKIKIRAESVLSINRGYLRLDGQTPPSSVWDVCYEIEVAKKQESSAIRMDSLLKYGTDNETETRTYDFLRYGLPSENGNYVCCVRVREVDNPNWKSKDDDYYYLYMTGPDMRFGPDVFGLDITKTYDVYMQALWPNTGKRYDLTQAEKDAIWNEYSSHLDSNGKYVNGNYQAGEQYVFRLEPPAVQISCDGVFYPGADESYQEKLYILDGTGKQQLGSIQSEANGTVNILDGVIHNDFRYAVYREDKDGNWQWLYGYEFDDKATTTRKDGLEKVAKLATERDDKGNIKVPGGYQGTNRFGHLVVQPGQDPSIKNDVNGNRSEAVGKYHIVAGFVFANSLDLNRADYMEEKGMIKRYIPGDFNAYYYKAWDCTINVEITVGLTLQLSYEGQDKSKPGYIIFPLPTDSDFPFNGNTWDINNKSYSVYTATGEYLDTISNVEVQCTESNGVYTITLMQSKSTSKAKGGFSYGSYKWAPGDTSWSCVSAGVGSQITESYWKPRIYFNPWGEDIMIELPIPGQGEVDGMSVGETKEVSLWKDYWNKDDVYADWNMWYTPQIGIKVVYTRTGDGYEAVVTDQGGWTTYGTWTWSEGQTDWRKK